VGEAAVIEMPPIMGGEDFARYGKVCPAVFFNVGTKNDEKGFNWPHHHPRFDIDEEGLGAGMATMAESVLRYLAQATG
jgi:amidohydrolase